MEKQAISKTEKEPLIKLGEEIEYKGDNVVNLAQMLKEDIPDEFKERAQRALQESAKMAKEGQRSWAISKPALSFAATIQRPEVTGARHLQ